MSNKKQYTREQLIRLYAERCREKGKKIKVKELKKDKALPGYNTFTRYNIHMSDLYDAAGYSSVHYNKQQLIDDYMKECKKEGRILKTEDVKSNDRLASYTTYNNHDLNMEKLYIIAGYKKKKKEQECTYNNLEQFCTECAEKDNCQYNYNLEKCEYYKEVESDVL